MYPRVKVRDYEDTTPVEKEMASDLVRSMDSLSVEAHCSSRPTCHGSVCNSGSSILHAKVFKPYPKTSVSPSTLRSQGKTHNAIDEYNTKNVRATSVPRPRAVLSSPDNDEMIGNLNQLNRKGELVTTPERKNHGHDASRITSKKSPLVVKGGTPSRSRPLSQNKHAQVKVSLVNARLSAPPPKTREITIEDGKKTHLVEKRSSNLMTPKLRPSTTSRTQETTSVGCKNSNLVEKCDSDSTMPALRSSTRSRVREINIEGCKNTTHLVERHASDLTTLKLRPSVKRV